MSDTPASIEELIMLYADGVLAPGLRPRVRRALTSNEEHLQLLESYLFTRGEVAQAFDELLNEPPPDKLLKSLRAPVPPRSQPKRRSSVMDWIADLIRVPVFNPAAAIPAILVGVAAGWLGSHALRADFVPLEKRGYVASLSLQRALEQTPSGASASIDDGLTFKPGLTFASVEQSWCRQYLLDQAAFRSEGMACRMPDGAWRVIILTEPEPQVPTTTSNGSISRRRQGGAA